MTSTHYGKWLARNGKSHWEKTLPAPGWLDHTTIKSYDHELAKQQRGNRS